MQRQHTATLRSTRPDRRPWLMAACSAALLAVVAAGAWQTIARREATTTTTFQQTSAATAPAPVPASVARHIATPRDDAMTLYVVGSAEEATRLTETLLSGDTILAQLGRQPFNVQVLVAASPEEEAAIIQANAEADNIRAGMGLPPISLINLRAP